MYTTSPILQAKAAVDGILARLKRCLGSETVQSPALAFEGVDDIERGDSLSLGVFSVGDRVSDNVLKAIVSDILDGAVDTGWDRS